MPLYSVIDIDPAMNYEPGEEVLGTVEATTQSEAIHEVLKTLGILYVRAFDPKGFDAEVLPYLKAVRND